VIFQNLNTKKGNKMKKMILKLTLITGVLFSSNVFSAEFRSHEYCDQLATIGMNAYKTKMQGHSLSDVTNAISNTLKGDDQKTKAANGVAIAIYGDNSITSTSEAYSIVYNSCKR
jgi:hypothetical protein